MNSQYFAMFLFVLEIWLSYLRSLLVFVEIELELMMISVRGLIVKLSIRTFLQSCYSFENIKFHKKNHWRSWKLFMFQALTVLIV